MAELKEVTEFRPTVSIGINLTKNLGNYESVKLSINISDQPRGEESVKDTVERIHRYVEKEIDARMAEYGG